MRRARCARCLQRRQAGGGGRDEDRGRARARAPDCRPLELAAIGDDLSFLTVRVEDKDGNLCPLADNLVRFHVEGAGSIAAVDNGNAATTEPFQADHRKAFSGMALLIVRANKGQGGRIQVTATSEGLQAASAGLTAGR